MTRDPAPVFTARDTYPIELDGCSAVANSMTKSSVSGGSLFMVIGYIYDHAWIHLQTDDLLLAPAEKVRQHVLYLDRALGQPSASTFAAMAAREPNGLVAIERPRESVNASAGKVAHAPPHDESVGLRGQRRALLGGHAMLAAFGV